MTTPDAVEIRPAREADFDAVARVWLESWESTGLGATVDSPYAELRARIPGEIATGWRLFVAESEGEIVAMLAVRPQDCHLDQIFVAPGFQGQGLGKRLLDLARRLMPREMWLRTSVGNVRAWSWYEREGFVRERLEDEPGWTQPRAYYRWRAP